MRWKQKEQATVLRLTSPDDNFLFEDTDLFQSGAFGVSAKSDGGEILLQEPEAEDEANGWEFLSPQASEPSTELANYDDGFIMACLDPECDASFAEAAEMHRCAACRLQFCRRHVKSLQFVGGSTTRSMSSKVDHCGGSASSSATPSCTLPRLGAASTSSVLDLLCVPMGYAALLCRECHAALAPPCNQARVGGLDPHAAPLPTNVTEVATQAQILLGVSVATLKISNASEEASKTIARTLLLRLLTQLQHCLRPWTGLERSWLWNIRHELTEKDPCWVARFAQQARFGSIEDASDIAQMIEKRHRKVGPRDALQILGSVGRHAYFWGQSAVLGERRLGMIATSTIEAADALSGRELACFLELLLDAAEALSAAGASGGRRAIKTLLLKKSIGDDYDASLLRAEYFWALEARVVAASASTAVVAPVRSPPERLDENRTWACEALEELLREQPAEVELDLLRQRDWVRHIEQGELDAAKELPCWGEARAFPIAVWHPSRRCLGVKGQPSVQSSANAPVIIQCGCTHAFDKPSGSDSASSSSKHKVSLHAFDCMTDLVSTGSDANQGDKARLLFKRDALMSMEQQVAQIMRLLEHLIWQDENMRSLLTQEGLEPEEVRVTYGIAMTGPNTAIVEFVEGASTLRAVRSGKGMRKRAIREYLEQGNTDCKPVLKRLAFTAAMSAVLSFVAGLGDRHNENFIVTSTGRMLHVDYGYALGREPLDSVVIHYMMQGEHPVATIQYEELSEALGHELIKRIFWPVVLGAYRCVRQNTGLLLEMVYTAHTRLAPHVARRGRAPPASIQSAWNTAQSFLSQRCMPALSEACAERFIHTLLWHCAHHESGSQWRDTLKEQKINLGEEAQRAVGKAYDGLRSASRRATPVLLDASSAAKGAAFGFFQGVRILLKDSRQDLEEDIRRS